MYLLPSFLGRMNGCESPIGQRSSVDVLLKISVENLRACGQTIFQSLNGVMLVPHVPSECIVGVVPLMKWTLRIETSLKALFRSERS